MGLKDLLSRVYHGITWFVHRPGIEEFMRKYQLPAMEIVAKLATVNNNTAFGGWKDEAFNEVRAIAGDVHDNWIAILIHLAYENLKGHATVPPGQ